MRLKDKESYQSMMVSIMSALESNSNFYYKIKNKREARWFADEMLSEGYTIDKEKFLKSFDIGRDCLALYPGGYASYMLAKDEDSFAVRRTNIENLLISTPCTKK